jgi:hypothetical protein
MLVATTRYLKSRFFITKIKRVQDNFKYVSLHALLTFRYWNWDEFGFHVDTASDREHPV